MLGVTGEYATLPDELVHQVRFSAEAEDGKVFFEQTIPLHHLASKSVALTFEPETIEDQELVNSYGGLDNTPLYLIHLRPLLTVAGEREIIGQGGLTAGLDLSLTVELNGPSAGQGVKNLLIAGYPTVIGLAAQQAPEPAPIPEEDKNAERLLFERAMDYIDRGNKAEEELASLLQLRIARPLPTMVTVGGVLDVVYLLDSPHGYEWQGAYVDADLRIVEVLGGVSPSGTDPAALFMQLASLENSQQENRILEEGFEVEAVSTAKLLALAGEEGLVVTAIDSANIADLLPNLNLPGIIAEDIANSVNQGYVVTTPETELSYEDWTGFAYIKENPETFESGWMLSGEIAGGMTAWGLDRWPDYYLDKLGTPFSEPPVIDPESGQSIKKIAATDMQSGEVGSLLAKKLKVLVRDKENKPVQGAKVTFTVKAGGGMFSNDSSSIIIESNSSGIAEVDYTLGKCTDTCTGGEGGTPPPGNPAYMYLDSGDANPTLINKNLIYASLDSGAGIATPFTLYGLPGEPESLEVLAGGNSSGYVLTWIGFAGVRALDQYGNPVANVPVDFSVSGAVEKDPCPDNPNMDLRPALLLENESTCMNPVPLYGQCGQGSLSGLPTYTTGEASVQVMLGGVPNADYVITAGAGETGLSTDITVSTHPFGACDGYSLPWSRIIINAPYFMDSKGNIVNAVKAGGTLPLRAKVYWVMENELILNDQQTMCQNGIFECAETVVGGREYDIITEFDSETVTFGEQAAQATGSGEGKFYEINYKVNDKPRKESVTIHADTKKQVRVNKDVCSDNCRIEEETINLLDEMVIDVYAVDIKPDGDYLIPLDEEGRASCDVKLPFDILPAEYTAASSTVVLKKEGVPIQYIPAELQGRGFVQIAGGYRFEPEENYSAQIVLNMGSDVVEIASKDIPITFQDVSIDLLTIEGNKYPIPLGGAETAVAKTTPAGRKVIWSIPPVVYDQAKYHDGEIKARIDAQTGRITVDSDSGSGWFTFRATDAAMPCVYKDAMVFIGCSRCLTNYCVLEGQELVQLSSVDITINLGVVEGGASAGDLHIRAASPSASLATPTSLNVYSLQHIDIIRDEQRRLRQLRAERSLIDIVVIDEFGYDIIFYRASDVLEEKSPEGLYQLSDTAEPFTTWRLENPAREVNSYNTLVLSQLKAGVVTKKYTYTWVEELRTWTLDRGDGAQLTSKEYADDPLTKDHLVTETVKTAEGEIASVHQKVYHAFPWDTELEVSGGDGGSSVISYRANTKLIKEIIDPDGAALTTNYEYYDDSAPAQVVGRIKSQSYPGGDWVRYEYDDQGRKITEIRPWLDSPITAPPLAARTTTYEYEPVVPEDSGSALDKRQPRVVTEKIQGVVVSRTYYGYIRSADDALTEIVERAANPTATYGAAGNMRTESTFNPSGTEEAGSGEVASVLSSDGLLTTYTYEYGTYATGEAGRGTFTPGEGKAIRTTVVSSTAENPEGIAHKTTSRTTIADTYGNTVEQYSSIYTGSGYEIYEWTVYLLDEFGRPEKTINSDSTSSETLWGCCNKESETDSSGITTSFIHDTMNRPAVTTREGLNGDITTTRTYDAAGRTLTTTVEAGGLSQVTENGYDKAGRLLSSIDASGLRTEYDYDPSGLSATVTRPGGATEITTNYPDGRMQSVTGTGVIPQYYEYGINDDGSQWTKVSIGSIDSPRWEKSYTDLLGRSVKTEQPGFNGIITSQNFYNDQGRLIRSETTGRAAMVYEYDQLGNQYRAGIDIDGNGKLDPAGMDRISESDDQYVQMDSGWWHESKQYLYAGDNDGTKTLTSTQRSRESGFSGGMVSEAVSIDIHGNESVSTTLLDPAAKQSISTVDYPGVDNDQVTISEYGLPVSSTSASGLTVTYDYDGLGRKTGVTDPRTGRSSIHYDADGRVDYVEDAAGNRTYFGYDPSTGRKTRESNALGIHTRYRYDDLGQLTNIWGAATYPVSYEYDEFGRRTHMYTYQTGSGWDGESWPSETGTGNATIWHYDEATGLLTAKEDAAGKKVLYSYTTTNQLETRTWARKQDGTPLTTHYSYDPNTGELTLIDYSDTTHDIGFSYDRIGRRKTISDAVGERIFEYTEKLQLESETITGLYNKTITRNYEQSGLIGRPTGFNVGTEYSNTYGYDPATGRFTQISWDVNGSTGSVDYGYLANSDLLETVSFNSGAHTTYEYESNRNLKTRVKNEFNTNLISQYDYQYDPIGRRKNVLNSGSAFTKPVVNSYHYNSRNELIGSNRYLGSDVTNTSQPVEREERNYAYDNIGNRKQATDWDVANDVQLQLTYTANQLNQYDLITADTTQADETPSYDDDGNMTRYKGKVYTYNAENRLVTVEPELRGEGDNRLEFAYDYMGRRVSKKVYVYAAGSWMSDSELLFLYNGWNMIAELDGAELPLASYVWGLDLSQSLQGAGGVGGVLARIDEGANKALNYLYDVNGNVGQLVEINGGLLAASYQFDPYGNLIESSGAYARHNPYRFSTKYFDRKSELYYYGYRYYSPRLGRWLGRDPIGEEGGLHLYGFVYNNPLNLFDVNGLTDWKQLSVEYYQESTNAIFELVEEFSGQIGKQFNDLFLGNPLGAGNIGGVLLKQLNEQGEAYYLVAVEVVPVYKEEGAAAGSLTLVEKLSPDIHYLVTSQNRDSEEYRRTSIRTGYKVLASVTISLVFERCMGSFTKRPGSGPAPGILEISHDYKSAKAVRNYNSPVGHDYVFDTKTNRLVIGKNTTDQIAGKKRTVEYGHERLASDSGMNIDENIVAGTVYKNKNGKLVFTENSGHYGRNWTDMFRGQFDDFIVKYKLDADKIGFVE